MYHKRQLSTPTARVSDRVRSAQRRPVPDRLIGRAQPRRAQFVQSSPSGGRQARGAYFVVAVLFSTTNVRCLTDAMRLIQIYYILNIKDESAATAVHCRCVWML